MDINQNILVSISCVSYNHEKYLEECLKSLCNQKTDFKFEILIHDDASTDRSQEIIKSFEEKYPDIVKPIYQTENQFSKGSKRIHSQFNYPRMKGKYIAIIEGDDYWTDELKLSKQIKLLEENPNCSLSFHANKYIFPENLSFRNKVYRPVPRENNIYTIEDVIKYGGNFMHTGSMVYRKSAVPDQKISWIENSPVGDLVNSLYLSLKGDIIYCDDVMSSYRVFADSSWSKGQRSSLSKQKAHYSRMVTMWKDFDEYTSKKHHNLVQKALKETKFNRQKGMIKFYLAKLGLRK